MPAMMRRPLRRSCRRRKSAAVEARFVWLDGSPMMIAASRDGTQRPLDVTSGELCSTAAGSPLDCRNQTCASRAITERMTLGNTTPIGMRIITTANCRCCGRSSMMTRRHWFHISPITGDIIGRVDCSRRTYRWLFNAPAQFRFSTAAEVSPGLGHRGVAAVDPRDHCLDEWCRIGWRYLRG